MDIYIWYVRFYLEAIGGACRVGGRRYFFFLPHFFFSFPFFPFPFFSPLLSLFSLLSIFPFKLAPPLQCSSIFLVYVQLTICMPMVVHLYSKGGWHSQKKCHMNT